MRGCVLVSQVEIDEYRDYDKAVGALKEAAKHMAKSRGPNKVRTRVMVTVIMLMMRQLLARWLGVASWD